MTRKQTGVFIGACAAFLLASHALGIVAQPGSGIGMLLAGVAALIWAIRTPRSGS